MPCPWAVCGEQNFICTMFSYHPRQLFLTHEHTVFCTWYAFSGLHYSNAGCSVKIHRCPAKFLLCLLPLFPASHMGKHQFFCSYGINHMPGHIHRCIHWRWQSPVNPCMIHHNQIQGCCFFYNPQVSDIIHVTILICRM